MERRDYLMNQIEEMGRFFAILVSKLHKRIEHKEEDQLMEDVRGALSVEFGWDLEDLLFLDNQSFIGLMEENLLSNEHYEKMAAVFELLGSREPENHTLLRKELYLRKALLLLEHLEYKSSTWSLERRDRIAQINMALSR
ncbi:MAG: hypothetical protein AAGU19_10860 [Prolixibacteraceae bacterium]